MTKPSTPCEIWIGYRRPFDGRAMEGKQYAYRTRWERERGPLGPDIILHHLCEQPACVRLDHLEPITQGVHLAAHGLPGDWGQADKSECPSGHPYDEANTYTYHRKDGTTERHCRECTRQHKRAWRARQRANNF